MFFFCEYISNQENQQIAQRIREFYFKDAAIDEKTTLKQYIDMLTDLNFHYSIEKSARRHAVKSGSKAYYLQ